MIRSGLPHFAKGIVVKGFGRGSKELGCPTANFPVEVVKNLPFDVETGVYCGFAQVKKEEVHKMVMSIGWNPFYQNTTKSMEIHILYDFENDFYGEELKVIVLKYLRSEKNFNSVNELIEAIKTDIEQAHVILNQTEYATFKEHDFFKQ